MGCGQLDSPCAADSTLRQDGKVGHAACAATARPSRTTRVAVVGVAVSLVVGSAGVASLAGARAADVSRPPLSAFRVSDLAMLHRPFAQRLRPCVLALAPTGPGMAFAPDACP